MDHQSSQILSDPELDELLRSVKVRVPLPGTFQVEVWRRIAVSQEAALPVRISRWMDGFFNLLVRPTVATAAVLLMISAGAWLGSVGSDAGRDGKQAYVQSVSPFAQTHEGGHQ